MMKLTVSRMSAGTNLARGRCSFACCMRPRHCAPDGNGLQGPMMLSAAYEDAMGIDDYEHAAAAGKHSSLLIGNFGAPNEASATFTDFMGFDPKTFVQRNRPKIFHVHLRSCGDHVAQFAQLAHGFVENCGDDASMAVVRRAGIAPGKTKTADEAAAFLIEEKF